MAERTYYYKLVRDGTRHRIDGSYGNYDRDEDFKRALMNKLMEEAGELASARTNDQRVEEMADVLEVVEALTKCLGRDAVADAKAMKRGKYGGFDKRVKLVFVDRE